MKARIKLPHESDFTDEDYFTRQAKAFGKTEALLESAAEIIQDYLHNLDNPDVSDWEREWNEHEMKWFMTRVTEPQVIELKPEPVIADPFNSAALIDETFSYFNKIFSPLTGLKINKNKTMKIQLEKRINREGIAEFWILENGLAVYNGYYADESAARARFAKMVEVIESKADRTPVVIAEWDSNHQIENSVK